METKPCERRLTPSGWATKGLLALIGILVLSPAAAAQEVVVHDGRLGYGAEDGKLVDGKPGPDADGVKNGVVVWKAGAVHVVSLNATYSGGAREERLVIEPGAVVKIAQEFVLDSLGRVTRWRPTTGSNGHLYLGTVEARGVTITDIRDDTAGGDTNQDGAASSPATISSIQLGGDGAVLEGSTLRHLITVNLMGPIQVLGNAFETPSGTLFVYCEASTSPLIRHNTFTGASNLFMRGCTPAVENNRFTGGGTIGLGPDKPAATAPWGPQSGTAIVAGNQLEGDFGIEINDRRDGTAWGLDQVAFHARILDNVLLGGRASLRLDLKAYAQVSGNEVTTSQVPIGFSCNECATSRLVVNANRFYRTPENQSAYVSGIPSRLWRSGVFVDAENNYWDDPSGPLDAADEDSLLNLRGKGIQISSGIDYVPFIGGTPAERDDLHITVAADREAPLEPGRTVTFVVAADRLRLNTATAATLYAVVRAGEDEILESTEMRVAYTDLEAELPPIRVEVPAGTKYLSVEAQLAPDGSRYETVSNQERFEVDRPKDTFELWTTEVAEVATGRFPAPVAGDPLRVRLKLGYTLTTSNPSADGRIEVYADARVAGTTNVLQAFPAGGAPLAVLPAPPGTNRTVETELEMTMPLWDVVDQPRPVELHGKIVMRDDDGEVVARASHSVPIGPAATFLAVAFNPAFLDLDDTLRPLDQDYFDSGAWPAGFMAFTLDVRSQTAAGWRIRSTGRALTPSGNVQDVYSDGDVVTGIDGPSPGAELYSIDLPRRATLHEDVRSFRNTLDVVTSGGIRVATVSNTVEVRPWLARAARDVPAGATEVSLDEVDVLLDVASNRRAGTVTAAEIAGPYRPLPSGAAAKTADYAAWDFLPTGRYWAIHATLQEGEFAAKVTFTYDPATDFPADPGFREDSLVVAGLNPLSGALEALPTVLDKAARTVTTDYTTFFETYVVAARRTVTVPTAAEHDVEVPSAYALEPNYPNPFNPSTTFVFRTPAPGEVRITVYDALGREVSRAAQGVYPAGVHRVAWDGRDAGGLPVPSGVYLVRMQAGRFSQTRTAVLLR